MVLGTAFETYLFSLVRLSLHLKFKHCFSSLISSFPLISYHFLVMKRSFTTTTLALGAIMLCLLSSLTTSQAQLLGNEKKADVAAKHSELTWHSITDGLKLAAEQKKPLLVDFYTDWCSWCKVMDEKTYAHHEVVKTLKSSFVLAKFNPEKAPAFEYQGKKYTGQEFAKLIGVSGYPTTAFLKPDGTKIDAPAGYIEFSRFNTMLDFVESKKYETEKMRLEEYMLQQDVERDPNNPRFRLNLAQYYIDSVNYKKSLEIFQYVAEMAPKDRNDLFTLHSGLASTQYFFVKDYKNASQNFQKSLAYASEPQSKARVFLLTAFAEAGGKQPKASVEYLDKFVKHCKENKLGTDGVRQMLEKAPQLEPVRTSQEFQQFLKKLR